MLKYLFTLRNKWLNRLAEKKQYPLRLAYYKNFIKPGDRVFDVGANMGNRVSIFLQLGAKVVAVEPQPDCQAYLQKQFGNSIIIEPVGLGESDYEAEMLVSNESTLSTLSKTFVERTSKHRFEKNSWDKKITVQVTTLDKLIEKYGLPQFCKIDVEGFEEQVLKGLTHVIPYLSFEYCVPEMNDNLMNSLAQLHRIQPLAKYNYAAGETMQLELMEWVDYETICRLVAEDKFVNTLFGDIYFKN